MLDVEVSPITLQQQNTDDRDSPALELHAISLNRWRMQLYSSSCTISLNCWRMRYIAVVVHENNYCYIASSYRVVVLKKRRCHTN